MGVKTRTIANNLNTASGAQAIGSIQQVNYTAHTSFTGSGRGSSHIISGLNMTFTRESQTSKTLLSYNITIGTQIDMWLCLKIQYSTDGSSFTDVPGITDAHSNTSLPRGHIGFGYRAGGSNSFSEYTSNPCPVEVLHDSSGIASNTVYYRIIIFNGHGTHNRTLYINQAENMASTGDSNRNCGISTLTATEIL
jgi:hypothetical protein